MNLTQTLEQCRSQGKAGLVVTDRTLDYWRSLASAALYQLKHGNASDAIHTLTALVGEEKSGLTGGGKSAIL